MKRPLIVLAAGFVLGEVLALQGQKAVSQGLLWWLYAAAGLFGVWSYRMFFPPSGGKRQEKQRFCSFLCWQPEGVPGMPEVHGKGTGWTVKKYQPGNLQAPGPLFRER